MNIRNLLSDSYFQQKKVVEKLLCHYTWITKEQLFTSYEKELTKEEYDAIKLWYDAYTKDKKPLEFIMWYVEFFQRKFKVDSRCLIPRPETEYMIEGVNEEVARSKELGVSNNILIDVGTGCGVLGLSVLLENPTFFKNAFLTEYYPETLNLAKENYETYKTQLWEQTDIKLLQGNLVAFLLDPSYWLLATNYYIVANLPYIPDETFDTQAEDNVKKREPRPAFVWWKDWLDFYREMFGQLFEFQKINTTTSPQSLVPSPYITMFLEMMTRQVDILRQEFSDKIDFEEIKTFHFNIRIVKGTLK